jgi:hypothetical protein
MVGLPAEFSLPPAVDLRKAMSADAFVPVAKAALSCVTLLQQRSET